VADKPCIVAVGAHAADMEFSAGAVLLKHARDKNRELARLLRETRRLQQEKIQAERWAALGKLAAMVAHDLRSPLATIRCQAGLLQEGPESPERRERSVRAILAQVRNMTGYVDELLLFCGPDRAASRRRPYDVSALILSLQEAFSHRCLAAGTLLGVELGCRGARAPLDPGRMYRVLENLLQNALDAAGPGGQVLIASGRAENGDVVVRVADSGAGVPGPVRDRLFEPFATWGKAGGTGLGLAVVAKIVGEHGGRVWEEPWRLPGACFHVQLPGGPPEEAGG